MQPRASSRLPESLVFRAPAAKCLQLSHQKHCAPTRREWIQWPAKIQNGDALPVRLNRMPHVPPRLDYAQKWPRIAAHCSATPNAFVSFRSFAAPLPLPPWSLGKQPFPLNATSDRLSEIRQETTGAMTSSYRNNLQCFPSATSNAENRVPSRSFEIPQIAESRPGRGRLLSLAQ